MYLTVYNFGLEVNMPKNLSLDVSGLAIRLFIYFQTKAKKLSAYILEA
jgi:hypothetical protein